MMSRSINFQRSNSCSNISRDQLWVASNQFSQKNDEELVDCFVSEHINNGNLHETKQKAKALIQPVKEFAEENEIDEKILPQKVALSPIRTFYNKNAAERGILDHEILRHFFQSKPVQLLEQIYQNYHKRDHSKMNWLDTIRINTPYKEDGLLTNAELLLLVNAGKSGEGRTYWVCSALALVTFIYQSNKHIGNIFSLSETILKK